VSSSLAVLLEVKTKYEKICSPKERKLVRKKKFKKEMSLGYPLSVFNKNSTLKERKKERKKERTKGSLKGAWPEEYLSQIFDEQCLGGH